MLIETHEDETAWTRAVLQAIRGVRYGSVEVLIHDGRVVQIERREKVRLEEAGRRPDLRGRSINHDRRADRKPGGPEAARTEETAE
jgi:hypothetical protein